MSATRSPLRTALSLAVAATVSLLAVPAPAAPSPFQWTGFYVGSSFQSGLSIVDSKVEGFANDPSARQFDAATNFDLAVSPKPAVTGALGLRGGTGGSEFHFYGENFMVSDAFIRLSPWGDDAPAVSVGKFANPFGATWTYSDNAFAPNRPFTLNPFPYAAFADDQTNVLRAVGVKLAGDAGPLGYDIGVINGTGENANNNDQNFGFVGRLAFSTNLGAVDRQEREPALGYRPGGPMVTGGQPTGGLDAAASFLYSDDDTDEGQSGFDTKFIGFQGDIGYTLSSGSHIDGLFGSYTYDDDTDNTDDGAIGWSVGGTYLREKFSLGVRFGGWYPSDDDGSGTGISSQLPGPGIIGSGLRDQKVHRFEVGAGYRMCNTVDFVAQYIREMYDEGWNVGDNDDYSVNAFRLSAGLNLR